MSVTIISLGEGTEFLTKLWEWKMEFITGLVLLSARPVHHWFRYLFLIEDFALPGNTISNIWSTSFLGAGNTYHSGSISAIELDALGKLNWKDLIYSNAIKHSRASIMSLNFASLVPCLSVCPAHPTANGRHLRGWPPLPSFIR